VLDTYVAALQHDLVDLPADALRLGVVRKPTPWFHRRVDENERALGPPEALIDELAAPQEDLAARGMCDEGAHNAAWEECDFEAQYREHLAGDEPQAAIAGVLDRLASGTDVALVCYENTDRKRCHRTILREEIDSRR
jgi:uncharacterized protein YeaO (DUF488 family)